MDFVPAISKKAELNVQGHIGSGTKSDKLATRFARVAAGLVW